jgi:hypothetical protein
VKFTVFLNESQKKQLEYEIISTDLKVHLVRLIERKPHFIKHALINKNLLINRSRTLMGRTICVLEAGDWGEYEDCEYAWHNGEFELYSTPHSPAQFIE